uniref:VWFA domain-containing protein n=1 Tax=Scleropages formosus TaxID=113540 RepID=A0A8C9WMK6_SCLFO
MPIRRHTHFPNRLSHTGSQRARAYPATQGVRPEGEGTHPGQDTSRRTQTPDPPKSRTRTNPLRHCTQLGTIITKIITSKEGVMEVENLRLHEVNYNCKEDCIMQTHYLTISLYVLDAGTEIAFVLDGSGSIEPEDFEKAKDFISKVMKKVWESCFSCNFSVVQYGSIIRTELSLLENNDVKKALEKVKDIQQIKQHTITASAINHVLEHVFVAENGSREDSKKIIIVLTDGRIFLDPMNLTTVLNSPKMHNILRFAIGVGPVLGDSKGMTELQEIASKPHEDHLFTVGNYTALEDYLSRLEMSLIGMEEWKPDVYFLSLQETLVFGAVGAYDWSGGIILSNQANSTMNFLNTTSTEKGFSYLGKKKKCKKQRNLFVGSYFGAELCTLDTDRNLKTDYLLVGAPFFHHKGEEGKVYVYKLDNLQGIDGHLFARFGSTIASIGDIDGNGYNDVVVGAPLEGQDSSMGNFGSIYIFNSFDGGIRRHFSQVKKLHSLTGVLQDCDDCFSPIKVRLSFSLPHNSLDLPVRVLDGHNPTVYTAQVNRTHHPIASVCTESIYCVTYLINTLHTNMIVLGASDSFNLNIALANKGENSYHTSLLLTYPSILQFNKVSKVNVLFFITLNTNWNCTFVQMHANAAFRQEQDKYSSRIISCVEL